MGIHSAVSGDRISSPVYNILLKIRTFIQYYGCYACASVSIYKRPSYISFGRVYVKYRRSLVLRVDTYIMRIAFLYLLFFSSTLFHFI